MAYTSKSKINLGKYTPGSGWKDFDEALTLTMGKSMAFMEFNAKRWAKQTIEELKKNVPVDTGNLRDSIEIEDKLNTEGYIIVGVNEQKLIGPKKVGSGSFARRIPAFNYVPFAEKNARDTSLRFFVERIWFEIAKQKAEEIFR